MNTRSVRSRSLWPLFLAVTLFGCKSKQDLAIDQAKAQAAATGQTQQVLSIDKNGTQTTTTVHPAVPGQTSQVIETTTVSSTPTAPVQSTVVQQPNGRYANPAPGVATAGGAPIVRAVDVHVPAGTTLPIRINQRLSVKYSRAGEGFSGEVEEPIADANNQVVIPRGTPVEGVVDASHRRGHFKGSSVLQLRLTSLELNGTRYPIETRDLTRTRRARASARLPSSAAAADWACCSAVWPAVAGGCSLVGWRARVREQRWAG